MYWMIYKLFLQRKIIEVDQNMVIIFFLIVKKFPPSDKFTFKKIFPWKKFKQIHIKKNFKEKISDKFSLGNFSEAPPSALSLPSRKISLSIGNFSDIPATPDNTLRLLLKKRLTTKKVAMASVLNKRNLSSNTSTFDLLPVEAKLIAEQLTSLEVLFLQSIR